MPRYTDEDLLQEIRRVSDITDGDSGPTLQQFREHSDIADTTVLRRFGSWNDAVSEAGFEPREPQRAIPEDNLIEELRRLRVERGHIPTVNDIIDHGAHWPSTYKSRFGSWSEALAAAFDNVTAENASQTTDSTNQRETITPGPHVSNKELLDDLRQLADELGNTPRFKQMVERGPHRGRTYTDRFGSWHEALDAAGIEPPERYNIATNDLIADLRRLRDELDEKPTSTDVARDGEYAVTTYQRRFGSWSAALEEAFDDVE